MQRRPARPIAAFCLYHLGDAAFATTILAVLYNQYFAQQVAGGAAGVMILGRAMPGATLYSWLVSLTMLVVAVLGPVLGATADRAGAHRAWLRLFCVAGALPTLLMATVHPGQWIRGSILFALAYGAFAMATILYNAFLPGLAAPERMGRVSGIAWATGYLGGGMVLGLNLLVLSSPARFGLADAGAAMRACFAFAGVWWLVFAIPILAGPEPFPRGSRPAAPSGFRRVRSTLRELRRTPHLLRFLIAYLLYNDGVQTMVAMASIFAAAELGFTPRELVLLFLLIQATGLAGAPVAGWFADRAGHKPTLLVHVAAFLVLVVWARWVGVLGAARLEFWWIGAASGIFLGGIQSVSRSLLARWVPPARSGEIFGFFSLTGRFASVLGPLVFGALTWMGGALRPAILSVGFFFLAGGVLLAFVDEGRGERELTGGSW